MVKFEVTKDDIEASEPWSYRGNALVVSLRRAFPAAREIYETTRQSVIVLSHDGDREYHFGALVEEWVMFHTIGRAEPFKGEIRNGIVRMR